MTLKALGSPARRRLSDGLEASIPKPAVLRGFLRPDHIWRVTGPPEVGPDTRLPSVMLRGFPGGSAGKELACKVGDLTGLWRGSQPGVTERGEPGALRRDSRVAVTRPRPCSPCPTIVRPGDKAAQSRCCSQATLGGARVSQEAGGGRGQGPFLRFPGESTVRQDQHACPASVEAFSGSGRRGSRKLSRACPGCTRSTVPRT